MCVIEYLLQLFFMYIVKGEM